MQIEMVGRNAIGKGSRMKRVNAKVIVPILMAVMAVVFIYLGVFKYGFWDQVNGPKPGFFPVLIGGVLLLTSIIALFQVKKEEGPKLDKLEIMVIAGCLGIVVISYVIGLIPSCVLYLILWLKIFEKCSWIATLKVTIIVSALVIGVFVLWLQVPFSWGIFEMFL